MTPLRWVTLAYCVGAVVPPLVVLLGSPTPAWATRALQASLTIVAVSVLAWAALEILEWARARDRGSER